MLKQGATGVCSGAAALALVWSLGGWSSASAQEEPMWEGGRCAADEDCEPGLFCRDGVCDGQCREAGSACPGGYRCDGEACVQCISDADCNGTGYFARSDCSDRVFRGMYYDFDESTVRADQEPNLNHDAWCLRQFPQEHVTIEGHTDERRTDAYNMALGSRVARSVMRYLECAGISAERMDPISYGEARPVCRESNESCWRQNRRVEIHWRERRIAP